MDKLDSDVIRKSASGLYVNYGDLRVISNGGVRFAMIKQEAHQLGLLGSTFRDFTVEFPEFFTEMHLEIEFSEFTVTAYAFNREDLPVIGGFLSYYWNQKVLLSYRGKYIQIWVPGEPVQIRNIEDFYSNLTEKEISISKFKENAMTQQSKAEQLAAAIQELIALQDKAVKLTNEILKEGAVEDYDKELRKYELVDAGHAKFLLTRSTDTFINNILSIAAVSTLLMAEKLPGSNTDWRKEIPNGIRIKLLKAIRESTGMGLSETNTAVTAIYAGAKV